MSAMLYLTRISAKSTSEIEEEGKGELKFFLMSFQCARPCHMRSAKINTILFILSLLLLVYCLCASVYHTTGVNGDEIVFG